MRKLAIFLMLFGLATLTWAAENDANNSDISRKISESTNIIQEMTGPNANAGIPRSVIDNAKCIAVVPDMIQGGFIFGGRHGSGVATCRTANNSWSPPAPFSLTGMSWGAQVGGQSIDLIMMVMNDDGMQQLRSGHFKVGGEASVAAGPVGRQGSADAGWKAGILTYSRTKGAYAGLTIKGAVIQQDDSATKQLYGRDAQFSNILDGNVKMPDNPQVHAFLNTIQQTQQSAMNTKH
jgi:lipid-binding SYLF domain-containing protein